jgi:hypothetical protein
MARAGYSCARLAAAEKASVARQTASARMKLEAILEARARPVISISSHPSSIFGVLIGAF